MAVVGQHPANSYKQKSTYVAAGGSVVGRDARFVRIWVASQARQKKYNVGGCTPHQLLIDLSYAKPERALRLVFLIADQTDSPKNHSLLGGGPLLNILLQEGAVWALDKIDDAPATDGMRDILQEVLSYSVISVAVRTRVYRVLQRPL